MFISYPYQKNTIICSNDRINLYLLEVICQNVTFIYLVYILLGYLINIEIAQLLSKQKGGVYDKMSTYSKERLNQIWDKGKPIQGKNPDLYRKDIYGNTMYKPSYGKTSEMGWNVDHSKPQSKGGTDHLNNLQPMNSIANCKKNDKY